MSLIISMQKLKLTGRLFLHVKQQFILSKIYKSLFDSTERLNLLLFKILFRIARRQINYVRSP